MINLNTPQQTHKHMSHVLTLEAKRSAVRKKPLSHSIQVGANTLLLLVITLSMIVTFLYLAYANRNATRGYDLKELQAERNQLMAEVEVADMQLSKSMALTTLEDDAVITAMVRPSEIAFVGPKTAYALNTGSE
jgi:hypothetical protein